MSGGNFFSYVPIRTFALHADMFTVVRALNTRPWVVAIALGIPFALATWHYLWRVLPGAGAFPFERGAGPTRRPDADDDVLRIRVFGVQV